MEILKSFRKRVLFKLDACMKKRLPEELSGGKKINCFDVFLCQEIQFSLKCLCGWEKLIKNKERKKP